MVDVHNKFERLRKLAESVLADASSNDADVGNDFANLVHEIEVHQIELNIQNEALRQTQQALEDSHQNLRDLFDFAPVSYFVLDKRGRIVRANLTATYQFDRAKNRLEGQSFNKLVAYEDRDSFSLYYRQLQQQKQAGAIELWFGDERETASFCGKVESTIFAGADDDSHIRLSVTDITERKLSEQRLEAILQFSQLILQRASFDTLLHFAFEALQRHTSALTYNVYLFNRASASAHVYRLAAQKDGHLLLHKRIALAEFDNLRGWHWHHRQRRIELPLAALQSLGMQRDQPFHQQLPIQNGDELLGLIDIGARSSDAFAHIPTDFCEQIASQLGIALQQIDLAQQIEAYTQNLEETVIQRTNELRASQRTEHENRIFAEAMLKIVKEINQSLTLRSVLEHMLLSLEEIIDYDGARIIVLDADLSDPLVQYHSKFHTSRFAIEEPFSVEDYPAYASMMLTHEALLITDASPTIPLPDDGDPSLRAYLGVPIVADGRIFGFLDLFAEEPGHFAEADIVRLQAFAAHAAIAVNNANAYEQAQELAAQEERRRIARELHDAVSQSLFGISIATDALAELLDAQKLDRAKRIAHKVRSSAASANAEMRLLLLELRPLSFSDIPFGRLLNYLTTAFIGRFQAITITADISEMPQLPIGTKVALYRAVQDLLTVSAEQAHTGEIRLQCWPDSENLNVVIRRQGDASSEVANGSDNLKKRVERIGARLISRTEADRTTVLHLVFPVPHV